MENKRYTPYSKNKEIGGNYRKKRNSLIKYYIVKLLKLINEKVTNGITNWILNGGYRKVDVEI